VRENRTVLRHHRRRLSDGGDLSVSLPTADQAEDANHYCPNSLHAGKLAEASRSQMSGIQSHPNREQMCLPLIRRIALLLGHMVIPNQ
jgi:hypothetical protein